MYQTATIFAEHSLFLLPCRGSRDVGTIGCFKVIAPLNSLVKFHSRNRRFISPAFLLFLELLFRTLQHAFDNQESEEKEFLLQSLWNDPRLSFPFTFPRSPSDFFRQREWLIDRSRSNKSKSERGANTQPECLRARKHSKGSFIHARFSISNFNGIRRLRRFLITASCQ